MKTLLLVTLLSVSAIVNGVEILGGETVTKVGLDENLGERSIISRLILSSCDFDVSMKEYENKLEVIIKIGDRQILANNLKYSLKDDKTCELVFEDGAKALN